MGKKRPRQGPSGAGPTTTNDEARSGHGPSLPNDGGAAERTAPERSQDHRLTSLDGPEQQQTSPRGGRPLPPLPDGYDDTDGETRGSILLFYQYREPPWTEVEFHRALREFIATGERHHITGRGRVAPEGVNCTLTGTSRHVRAFCRALREWDPDLFDGTDFKITDNVPGARLFRSLSIRKADELVAYGMAGPDRAPSLADFGGTHLTAVDYHEALLDPDAVVIDVRNAYETALGTMRPPPGGAVLLDPKLRNSHEWPKWLAAPETQRRLTGKKVLTFCTGGIRCERATALINQMAAATAADGDFQPRGVYHMRGGIERYLKTFPQGGFWSGKNYLFDKRMEQLPEGKTAERVEQEVRAKCCLCREPWSSYRGKHKCHQVMCGVPVIVCDACQRPAAEQPQELQCELCREGYRAPQHVPDLVALKRKAEKIRQGGKSHHQQGSVNDDGDGTNATDKGANQAKKPERAPCPNRLFLSRLPLTVSKKHLEEWLKTTVEKIQWLTDKQTGAFYGSCIVQVDRDAVESVLKDQGTSRRPLRGAKKKRQPKISRAMAVTAQTSGDGAWPPPGCLQTEFPPMGRTVTTDDPMRGNAQNLPKKLKTRYVAL